jgi:hypothetical protein
LKIVRASSADTVPGQDGVPPDDQGVPPVEDYISDIEGCVEDLAIRLGMDEGQINIKVLAKMFRNLVIRYDYTNLMVSDVIDIWDAGSIWGRLTGKHNPVGYLLNEIEREMIKQNKENAADDTELESRFPDLFAGREYLPGYRISELMPDVDLEVSMALIKRLLDEGRIVKNYSSPNSYELGLRVATAW